MNQVTDYVLTNFKWLSGESHAGTPEAVAISGQHIVAVGPLSEMPAGFPRRDMAGLTLSPGFIDLQLNGCGGVLFNNDISADTLNVMHAANLASGCTTFLPTLITSSDEDIKQAIAVVAEYQQKHPERVPGLHLEGPYLNPARKGIHDPDFIRTPSAEMVDYLCHHASIIAMITLAPEMCEANVIRRLSDAGIVVSMGHTNASCAEAKAAEQAGVRFATHLHNAMTPLTSREPGVVGAVFDSSLVSAGIIADGYHLSWENLRIAHRIMQDRLILVSDATAAAGSDIAQFEFGGQTVYHSDGKCTGVDGTLGGSALTMMEAVFNSIDHGIEANAVIRMATINAARAIGKDHTMGRIAPGHYANLVFLDDNYVLKGTISGGSLKMQ